MGAPFIARNHGEFRVGDKVAIFSSDWSVRRYGTVMKVERRFYDQNNGEYSKPQAAQWGDRYGDLVTVKAVVLRAGKWTAAGKVKRDEAWLERLDDYIMREYDKINSLREFLK